MRLRHPRRRARLWGAIAAAALLTACTGPQSGHGSLASAPRASSPAHGTTAPSTTGAPTQSAARFADCNNRVNRSALPADRRERLSYSCAAITVPLDYAKPHGRTISLQLIKVHDSADKSPNSLLLNRGGPGAGGVDFAVEKSAELPAALLAHYDLIGFDPRGVGESTPVRCFTDKQKDVANAASPDVRTTRGFAQAKVAAAQFAKACTDKYGAALADFNTVQTAKDMDQIRQAIGDSKLNYLGFSYGTELGAQYAHLFPSRIGAVVLDGAVDPLTSDIKAFADQLQGFEQAFDQFAAWCKAHDPCKNVGDPRETVYNIAARATRSPIPSATPGETRKATSSLVYTGVLLALYSQSAWPLLGQALINAQQGNSAGLLQLADLYNERTNGHYTNINDANVTIGCNDQKPGPSDATIRTTTASWVKRFPMFGLWSAASLFSCQQWQPVRTVPPLPTARSSAQTILVLGNIHDPATPYQGAKDLTRTLGRARLLTWNGEGHTSFQQGSPCVDAAVVAYFDSGTVPSTGRTCPR